jgi:hypothetical protein
MTNSSVMGHIKRADRNLLILYVTIFTVCGLITALIYDISGLSTAYYVSLSITFIVIVICTAAYINRVSNLERRPIFKTLAKFGNFDDIRAQIDAEAVSNKSTSKAKLLFTQNWILQPYWSGLHVIHRPTLVWAHAKDLATRHYVNFIPTGTTHTYSVLIHYLDFTTVSSLEINTANQDAANDLLQHIVQYAPWIVVGYTPEIANLWKMNPAEMIAFVTHRYNAFVSEGVKGLSNM